MNFHQPQLLLLQDTAENYILHSITYLPTINLLSEGYGELITTPTDEGVEVSIELYVQDIALEGPVEYLNPVVHVVHLGNLLQNGGATANEVTVTVAVYQTDSQDPQIKQLLGSGIVKNPSTSMDSK